MYNPPYFTASGSARNLTWQPRVFSPARSSYKGRLSRTMLAAALLAFGALPLPAQKFSPAIESPFTIVHSVGPAAHQRAIADLNHDGLPDIVSASMQMSPALQTGSVSVSL